MAYPNWVQPLMATAPGTIVRRFPTYWSDGEGGIDWSVPPNTEIVALADGIVVGAGYFCHNPANYFMSSPYPCSNPGYGVITTRVKNADGSYTDLYYQHIILASNIRLCNKGISSCGGQVIKKGQVIGKANPQGFLEVGINVGNSPNPQPYPNGWGGIWGADKSPGTHVDPEPYIRNLIQNYDVVGGASLPIGTIDTSLPIVNWNFVKQSYHTVSESTTEILNSVPGFKGIVEALDLVEQFQPLKLQSGQTSGVEGPTDYTIFGIDTGIPNPQAITDKVTKAVTLPSDSIQAVLVFITTNTAAFVIRALLVFIGVIIIIALVQNILGKSTSQASDMISKILPLLL